MILTHQEDGAYYAVVTLTNGQQFSCGPFNCRSTARRYALRENERHRWAAQNHCIYNTRYL